MKHQSELMEALRDFAVADPEDCDQEWDAYLALLKKGPVSVSSPTSSTSPLHHRTRASTSAVTPPATTRSTMPLHTPSDATSSGCFREPSPRSTTTPAAYASGILTKDDLSPGARRMYDYLIGATDNLDEPAAATSTRAGTSTHVSVAAALDSTPAPVHSSSIVTTPSTSTESASATLEVSTVLTSPTEITNVPGAVDNAAADLAAQVPTTCSAECPSHDASVYAAAFIPSATTTLTVPWSVPVPSSATSIGGISEPTTDTATLGKDVCSVMSSGCLRVCLGGDLSAITFFNVPPGNSPITVSAEFMGPTVRDLLEGGDNSTMHPPWPPPGYIKMCKDMIQGRHLDDLILESTQLMLWAAKNPWPPPFTSMSTGIQNILPLDCQDIPFMPRITLFPLNVESFECIGSRFGIRLCWFSSRCAGLLVYYFTSCRFPNLHGTMDIMQMTGDWHCLRIVKIEWSTNPAMIILALVQFAELQPIALKWTDQFCHDTHSLVASSRADMLLDSLLGRQDIGTWMLLDLGFTSVHFQGTITVQQSTSSVVVFAVLNRTEVHKHYTCMRVLTVAVCKEWIQHWVLRIDSHSVFFCCALEQWKIPWTIILVSFEVLVSALPCLV